MAIFNKYKNSLEDVVNSLDIELLIIFRPNCKGPYNIIADLKDIPIEPKLDNQIEPKLDKDFLDGSLRQQ